MVVCEKGEDNCASAARKTPRQICNDPKKTNKKTKTKNTNKKRFKHNFGEKFVSGEVGWGRADVNDTKH